MKKSILFTFIVASSCVYAAGNNEGLSCRERVAKALELSMDMGGLSQKLYSLSYEDSLTKKHTALIEEWSNVVNVRKTLKIEECIKD
ncbi:MAG: hypothetical protein WA160_16175 [Pseudobdellovibrio sp.]